MKLSEIIEVKDDIEFFGTAIDSRKVKSGDLFAIFTDDQEVNLTYIKDALDKGAVAILTNAKKIDVPVPVIYHEFARKKLGLINQALYQPLPTYFVAVTGTNGKTSTAVFLRQIWEYAGLNAASIGTLGVESRCFSEYTGWTTADNVTLHKELHKIKQMGITHVVLEASSHGLAEDRLSGLKFVTAGFTNLTQDHLDYHKTMGNYFAAKMKLFTDYMQDGATVVINADIPEFEQIKAICEKNGLNVWSYGINGKELKLIEQDLHQTGQDLKLKILGCEHTIPMKITGSFQAWNALCALGMAIASGIDAQTAIASLSSLQNPEGRMELVGTTAQGASIYVDFAHTPDGIENALKSLRHHTQNKLWIALGCGGNRDTTKRPKMGALAEALADRIIVTDDNPRYENPADIRKQIMVTTPKAIEIGDREKAICYAIDNANEGDVILLAGKGHEEGQIIQGKTYPFNDKLKVLEYLKKIKE